MARKTVYNTKQMDRLLTYMQASGGRHVTAAEICRHFEEEGTPVGTATVYRNLEKLVEQGMVAKYNLDATSSACFEYIGAEEHAHHTVCYHCKCEKCGQIIHMECEEVTELGKHFLEHHGFAINYQKTIFYGLCEACREKEAADN